jgi:hypothetical protein
MTAVNGTIDGMPNTRESAILAEATEAVEWRHQIEPISVDGKRMTSRMVIYPAEMPLLEEALTEFSRNPSEQEDGSHIAYSKILEKCAEYESPPRFFREDSSEILNDPELATSVPIWMNTAAQVSVGSRNLVLENGPDVMNSSDEDSSTEEHGDQPTGMYVGDFKAPVLLTQSEVARQKATASYAKSVGFGKWIPMGGSEIETSGASDTSESETPPNPQTDSGKKGPGKKAATRPADTGTSHPMVTRHQASRAGGLQPMGGSGQTDTYVASSHPS